ncbi:MAG: SpoIIE family protein phosphatase [Acidimicrobiales bacterium]|nr:SpoIIE family protein phosphatase [Acidimicrobiales bacterium]
MALDRRERLAAGAIVAILVFTAMANLLAAPETVPPLLTVVVPVIAAAFFSARVTAGIAIVSVVEGALLAHFSDGRTGAALWSRVAMTVGSGILAIALAEMRIRREQEISDARHELQLAGLLQAVVDSSNDPIYAKDVEGRYLAANNAAAASLGLSSGAEVIGRRDRDFVAGERAEGIEADDRETLASGGRLEFEEVADVPGRRIFLTHKTVLRDAGGSPIGLSGIAKDVTVKRHAQDELARSEHRFRSLVEASSDIVWRTDRTGGFAEPQGGWLEYTGQSWEEHKGLRWLDAVHPDDRERFGDDWSSTIEAGCFNELTARLWNAATGTHRVVVIRAAPVVGADASVIEWLCICEDDHDAFTAEQRRLRIADAKGLVAEVAASGAAASGTQQVAEGALDVLQRELPDHVGSVTLLDRADPSVTRRFAVSGVAGGVAGLPASTDQLDLPSGHVVEDRRSAEFADVEDLLRSYPDAEVLTRALQVSGPTFVSPLDAGPRVMGALTLSFREPVDDEVLDVVRLCLPELNAVLANNLLQAEFHEREAEIASTLQQSMLELAIEDDPRLALSVHYQAGAEQMEAGGDWYDVVALADGRIALIVGDVVGRSLKAATVMGRLRGACRGLVLATGDAAQVLSHLDTVAETIEGARYSTCCCVVLDPAEQTATYSSAGHPPVLMLPADGAPSFLWDAQGPPLTVPVERRPSATIPFPTGTRLFLYSDGLVERRNEVIDKGLDRLAAAVVTGRERSVDDECDRVATALFEDFAQHDDVAIVCAQTVSEHADEFHRSLPPDPAVLNKIRRDLRVWLTGNRFTPEGTNDVVLAVGEALANAMEHAAAPDAGVTLSLARIGRQDVQAVVENDGGWRENPSDPTRGRGLAVMEALSTSLTVDHGRGATRVRMVFTH